MDIGSSSVAASVTNLVCGATKSLTIDLGVLLEGQTPDTLPEQLLGTIRWVPVCVRVFFGGAGQGPVPAGQWGDATRGRCMQREGGTGPGVRRLAGVAQRSMQARWDVDFCFLAPGLEVCWPPPPKQRGEAAVAGH